MSERSEGFFTRMVSGIFVFFGWKPEDTLDMKSSTLKSLFADLDREVESFRRQAGLACPERCGHCCENARVETSELEMLPLAIELVSSGEAEQFYEAADKLDFEGRCVFYEADAGSGSAGRGRCGRYELRPLICRLFAFSGNADKNGQTRPVICGIIRNADPAGAGRVAEAVAAGQLRPPVMADYIMKASVIDMDLGREQLPINLAFKRAVDRVWLHRKFS